MHYISYLILLLTLSLSTACTWVKPSQGAGQVALVKASAAQFCKKLSTSRVQVKHAIGPFHRSAKKVNNELLTLARNQAVMMKADTVVAETTVVEGRQRFGLYRCQEH